MHNYASLSITMHNYLMLCGFLIQPLYIVLFDEPASSDLKQLVNHIKKNLSFSVYDLAMSLLDKYAGIFIKNKQPVSSTAS